MADPTRGFGPGSIIGPLTEMVWNRIRPAVQDRYGGVPDQPWNPTPQLRALGDIFSVGPNVSRALPRAESPTDFLSDVVGNYDPDLTYMNLQQDRFEQPAEGEDLTRRSPFSVHMDMFRGEVEPGNVRQAWERSMSQSMGLGLDFTQPGAEMVAPALGALASWGTFIRRSARNYQAVADNLVRDPSRYRNLAEGFGSLNQRNPSGDIVHTVGRMVDNASVSRTPDGAYELLVRGADGDALRATDDFSHLRNFDPANPPPPNSLFVSIDGDSVMNDLGALVELADQQGVTVYISPGGGFRPMQGRGVASEPPRFEHLGFELDGTINDMDALYVRRPYPVDDAARADEMARRGVGQEEVARASEDAFPPRGPDDGPIRGFEDPPLGEGDEIFRGGLAPDDGWAGAPLDEQLRLGPPLGDGAAAPDDLFFRGIFEPSHNWADELIIAVDTSDFEAIADLFNVREDLARQWASGMQRAIRDGREGQVADMVNRAAPELENLRRYIGGHDLDNFIRAMHRAGRETSFEAIQTMTETSPGGPGLPYQAIQDILDFVFLGQ